MRTTIRFRAVWLIAILLLAAALAFTACAGRQDSGNNGGQTTTQTQAAPDLHDLQSNDQSLQGITNSLQSAANDANTDYSSQDTPQQP